MLTISPFFPKVTPMLKAWHSCPALSNFPGQQQQQQKTHQRGVGAKCYTAKYCGKLLGAEKHRNEKMSQQLKRGGSLREGEGCSRLERDRRRSKHRNAPGKGIHTCPHISPLYFTYHPQTSAVAQRSVVYNSVLRRAYPHTGICKSSSTTITKTQQNKKKIESNISRQQKTYLSRL